MSISIIHILTLIGAVGLFIYGMKVMSEAIQKLAGARFRKVLSAMTATRFYGVLSGFGITAVLQSSSATTVMMISFVNAGLISLVESIPLIMGANLGTTITAWLVSILGIGRFSITALSLPLIAFSLPLLFFARERGRHYGEALLGFAIILLGLSFMREAIPPIESSQSLLEFMARFDYIGDSYWQSLGASLVFVVIGVIAAGLLQTSSAATALTLVLVSGGWISFPLGAAIVLGENIGTTISTNLAAVVANVHAKRAARFHLLFNLIGALWLLAIFPFFLDFIVFLSLWLFGDSPIDNPAMMPLGLSLFHTSFNLINLLLLIGFVPALARLSEKLVTARSDEEEIYSLEYISRGLMATPELSIMEARKELVKFSELIRKSYKYIPLLITEMEEKRLRRYVQRLEKYEDISDRMEIEISNYLGNINQSNLSLESTRRVRAMLQVANYLERIGDIYLEVSRSLSSRKEQKAYFTPEMRTKVIQFSGIVSRQLDLMVRSIEPQAREDNLGASKELHREMETHYAALKKEYLEKIENGKIRIQSGVYYSDLLAEMERIADHAYSIATALSSPVKK